MKRIGQSHKFLVSLLCSVFLLPSCFKPTKVKERSDAGETESSTEQISDVGERNTALSDTVTSSDTATDIGGDGTVDSDIVTSSGESTDTMVDSSSDTHSDVSNSDTVPDTPAATDKGTTTLGTEDINTDTDSDSDTKSDRDTSTDVQTGTDTGDGRETENAVNTDSLTPLDMGTSTDTDPASDIGGSIDTDRCCGTACVDCTANGQICNSADNSCSRAPCQSNDDCLSSEYVCNQKWGFCVVTECTGRENFTRCNQVTSPDRSYDICVDNACVSPGCGNTSCNVPGPHFPLADTNQRLCYNGSEEIPCPSESDPFYGQDAQYGWDLSYSANQRYTTDVTASGYPVVTDNVTGLSWQGCAAGQTGNTCGSGQAGEYTWEQGLAYCEDLVWGGSSDWRLPDPHELVSTADLGGLEPAIDTHAFPTTPSDSFWTSSTFVYDGTVVAFGIDYDGGFLGLNFKDDLNYVRCVRGDDPPIYRFDRDLTVIEQPKVVDRVTKLSWQGCPAGINGENCDIGSAESYTWEEALAYCQGLDWGGHGDWRLPNAKELQSIVDHRRDGPTIDATVFFNVPTSGFWSSSTNEHNMSGAWFVTFGYGSMHPTVNKASTLSVRCVRSGP